MGEILHLLLSSVSCKDGENVCDFSSRFCISIYISYGKSFLPALSGFDVYLLLHLTPLRSRILREFFNVEHVLEFRMVIQNKEMTLETREFRLFLVGVRGVA